MNLKGSGDMGQISISTHEYDKDGKYAVKDKFANFSTVQKGFQAYMNLLKDCYADSYSALEDPNKTISDFAKGLKKGGYATDPDYVKNVEKIFKGVKNDYLKMTQAQINSNVDCISGLMKQITDPNASAQSRIDASVEMRNLYEEKVKLEKDKKDIQNLK